MDVTVSIPEEFVEPLREAFGSDLSRAAVERFASEGYRLNRLSLYQVQRLLGFASRWEVEEWLGQQGIALNYSTDDLDSDRRALDQMLGPSEP